MDDAILLAVKVKASLQVIQITIIIHRFGRIVLMNNTIV